jgi:periplasmic protein TonB
MKAILISILALFSFVNLKAQDENKVFEKVEVNANTNKKAWNEHLMLKSKLPDSTLKNVPPGTYTVDVQFIIDKHGNIGQVKAKNDPGFGLAKKAVNVISTYEGVWQPASQCGRNVSAYKMQPVIFIVPAQ